MQAMSLDPETFVEGGGLFEGNAVLRQPKFVRWDYGGRKAADGTAISTLAIRGILVDDEGTGHEQFWSSGSLQDFIPSPDGTMAVPQAGKTGLNRNTNAAVLLAEFINSGFPKNRITASLQAFDGLYANWVRKDAPERTGLAQQPRADGRPRDNKILVPGQIYNLPWEPSKHPNGGQIVKMVEQKSGGGGQGQQGQVPGSTIPSNMPPGPVIAPAAPYTMPSAPVVAPLAGPSADLDPVIRGYLSAVLAGGPLTKVQLAQQVFQPTGGVNQHARRAEISSWVFNDGYLKGLADEGAVMFDGTTVTKLNL